MLNLPLHPVEVNTPKEERVYRERAEKKDVCVDANVDSEGQ